MVYKLSLFLSKCSAKFCASCGVCVCAVLVRTSLEAVLLYAGQQGKCLVWKEGELSLHYFII